ncbi:SDR family NAD(P)-dependent oxidoreductase [Ammoniphilus resinae]|uniref:3-oxoacyl-[acyl-carrier protein] reductase n=1 Tax=Ammoniphilus resinae TaxID=861532 RepID=A0ABS4GTF9_9BACL|nr:SDR family oxidoreductase [Ammoniphilus resinae]MBP1933559.1 3-oxoacyl-[acyl-carrier protein] reductase [Ammoniphilus resinae]
MGKLTNQVALVTGSGSGLGRGIAMKLASEGATVVIADLREGPAQETLHLIEQAGGKGIAVQVDVSNPEAVKNAIETVVSQLGQLDILVNNAGAPMSFTPVEEVSEELWDLMMDVNAKGPFLTSKYAVPYMKKNGKGSIINISSIASRRVRPGLSAYCASKGAVILLTEALAIELANSKVRVNAINPGPAETPMLPKFFASMDPVEGRKLYEESVPLGRLCQPEDIANMVAYLASEEASFITGATFNVDGGRGL